MNINNIISVLLFAYELDIYVGLAESRIWFLTNAAFRGAALYFRYGLCLLGKLRYSSSNMSAILLFF